MKKLVLVVLAVLFRTAPPCLVFAQYDAAALLLTIQPSLRANGMGGVSVASIEHDALAMAFNPGHAGRMANDTNFLVEFYPTKTDWLPGSFDITYDSKAIFGGYNFRRLNKNVPISIGVGYTRVSFDYGEQTWTDDLGNIISTFSISEHLNVWSVGLGFDHLIKGGIGWNFKRTTSNFPTLNEQGEIDFDATEASAHDFGIVAHLPLEQFFNSQADSPFELGPGLRPFLGPTFGYSKSNVGGEISYLHGMAASPLPRNARIGIGLRAGLSYSGAKNEWQIFSFEITNEAEDFLVRVRGANDGSFSYQSGLGDIDFVDNVLLGKSNPEIAIKRGGELVLFETVAIRRGHYKDIYGGANDKSYGVGISLHGLLKTIALVNPAITNSTVMRFLINHADVRFDTSETADRNFSGIGIRVF